MSEDQPIELGFLSHITDDDFKESLASDYREAVAARTNKSWKSAIVLAGSMVEAMLIDYLLATNYDKLGDCKILKMQLGEAIDACGRVGILSDKTKPLCSVIQGYRNLIHPGRIKRLSEKADEESAQVALALVRMIGKSISEKRQATYGFTAAQVMTKLEDDASAFFTLLPSIANGLQESERKKLLCTLLPERNLFLSSAFETTDDSHIWETLQNISRCFHYLYGPATQATRQQVMAKYVEILHHRSSAERRYFEGAFVRGAYLVDINESERATVAKHLFKMLKGPLNGLVLRTTDGLGKYISDALPDEYERFELLSCLASGLSHDILGISQGETLSWFGQFCKDIGSTNYDLLISFIKHIKEQADRKGKNIAVRRLSDYLEYDIDNDMPF